MNKIIENDKKYVAQTYARYPIALVGGKGALAVDESGREYIDMGSGIGVNCFGYCDEEWTAAVEKQLEKLQHTSNLYYTEPCGELARGLCMRTGMKKVFFSNSGAEANECAIKAARKYAAEKKGKNCFNIITLKNSFHGRTVTTLAATGQDSFHELFRPLTDGFIYADADDIEELKEKMNPQTTAALMLEVIQGEGGVIPLKQEYLKAAAELAQARDVLLIIDEVQTGNGRTGKLYGYMNYGIKPDIVTTAKGLGGGLPIGATLFSEKVENILTAGTHGSTFGGNPVVCAGAMSILNRLDEEFLLSVRKKSDYIFGELNNSAGIKSVSGAGLMIGVETEKPACTVAEKCMENGVLVLTAKNKVRLLPPLNISWELLEKAVKVIKHASAAE